MSNNKRFDPLKNIRNIGTSLNNFVEVPSSGKNYTFLGKGNFGYTEKMKSTLNNKIYAIKKLDKNSPNFILKDFIRETRNSMDLDHENIAKLYGYFEDIEKIDKYKEIFKDDPNIANQVNDKQIYCLVMEYVQNGTLENYYNKYMKKCQNNFVPLDQNFILKILKQLLNVLYYLGSKSIMHRDIKPDNILLDENNNIKLIDFGISALYYDLNPLNENKDTVLFSHDTIVGRRDFITPEMEYGGHYDFRADIFSLGLTMLFLMSNENPISLFKDEYSLTKSLRDIDVNKMDKNYNIYLRQLILRMLNRNINFRPYANQALEEVNYIEEIIRNPNNIQVKNYLDKKNEELNQLEIIGNKLSDFKEIPRSGKKYTLLGKGNFGYAEKMQSKKNNSFYAIKKLDINSNKFNAKDFLRETQNMLYLNHENIIKFYGYFEDKENINKYREINPGDPNIFKEVNDKQIYCLVMEYAQKGSLENYYLEHMKKCRDNFVPIEQEFIIKILKQLLSALYYIGSKSIMHRDIKPDNILLDENYNIKISDFGLSALFNDQNPININKNINLFSKGTCVGRQDFVSPEIENGQPYDFRTDIYSLGLTMLCLMSKEYPIRLKGKRNIIRDKIAPNYNIYLKKLVLRMISNDINSRPFANEALYEIENIEEFIRNPKNKIIQNYLEELNKSKDSEFKAPQIIKNNFQQNNQFNIQNNIQNNQNNRQNNQNIIQNNQFNTQNSQDYSQNNQFNMQNNHNNGQIFIQNNMPNNRLNIQNNNNININNQINFQNYVGNNSFQNRQNFQGIQYPNNKINQMNYQQFLPNLINMNYPQNNRIYQQFGFPNGIPISNYPFNPNVLFFTMNLNNLMNQKKMQNQTNESTQFPRTTRSQNSININSFKFLNKSDNSSLTKSLQCLYEPIKDQFQNFEFIVNDISKYKKGIFLTKELVKILKQVSQYSKGQISQKDFEDSIQDFRNIASLKIDQFKGNEEIPPIFVFLYIFQITNKEFTNKSDNQNKDIPWENTIFENLIEPFKLPRTNFPDLYDIIDEFKNNYSNPFVDVFYYISVELTICEQCNKVLLADNINCCFFLPLNSTENDKISFLISEYMNKSTDFISYGNYYCTDCEGNVPGRKKIGLMNSPLYLLIQFAGDKKEKKQLENEINLSDYLLTNIGKKVYELYALIGRNSNRNFVAFIKTNHIWRYYSDNNKIEDCSFETLNNCFPYIAIYKGIR
jgi:serine/threonine protein kinase